MKKTLLFALLLLPLSSGAYAADSAPQGDAKAGKALWEGADTQCKNCHGGIAEGAFGPDLAGRGLSVNQVKRAIRQPWGIMPAFVESQVSDKEAADLTAYFNSLPRRDEPGQWRFDAPAGAPPGQVMLVNLGCGQCHGVTLNGPRGNLGAVNADFEYFVNLVYNHTTALPQHRVLIGAAPLATRVRMGNFNRNRVTEADLREIYDWVRDDIGFRVPLAGVLSKAETDAKGATYKLAVRNNGLKEKGLTAEGVKVTLILPAGANVVAETGDGYQGTHMDADAKAMVAVWMLPKSAPKEEADYTITLSKPGTKDDNLRGNIRWSKPGPKAGPNNEVVNIGAAPL